MGLSASESRGGADRFPSTASGNARRHRRAAAAGFGLSLCLHAAVFLAWQTRLEPLPDTTAAGPRAGDARAAPGGGVMEVIAVAPPREIVVPPPPTAVPDHEAPAVVVRDPAAAELQAQFADLRSASFTGSQSGPGRAAGAGEGDGGDDAEGRFRVTAPEPRVIVPEWDPPEEVRGTRIQIRVLVSAEGRALDVELRPRTTNSGFNRRLIETYMRMDYKPGQRMGRPIAAPAEITLIF